MKTKQDEFDQAIDELKIKMDEIGGVFYRIRKIIDEATEKGKKLPW